MRTRGARAWDDVLAGQLEDPAFKEAWQRTALARAVATRLTQYRAERGLSQSSLARELGLHQPAVARLEAGETNPSIETLRRLSSRLGMEFLVHVFPSSGPQLMDGVPDCAKVVESFEEDGAAVRAAVL